jgi:Ca2+/H+ antiporter
MTNVVADGKSNWLEGAILICLLFVFRLGFSTAADIISMLQVFTLI